MIDPNLCSRVVEAKVDLADKSLNSRVDYVVLRVHLFPWWVRTVSGYRASDTGDVCISPIVAPRAHLARPYPQRPSLSIISPTQNTLGTCKLAPGRCSKKGCLFLHLPCERASFLPAVAQPEASFFCCTNSYPHLSCLLRERPATRLCRHAFRPPAGHARGLLSTWRVRAGEPAWCMPRDATDRPAQQHPIIVPL